MAPKIQAMFTTFGAQIWRYYEDDDFEKSAAHAHPSHATPPSWRSIDWAADGHQLWFVNGAARACLWNTVRSASLCNPSMVG